MRTVRWILGTLAVVLAAGTQHGNLPCWVPLAEAAEPASAAPTNTGTVAPPVAASPAAAPAAPAAAPAAPASM